MSETCIADSAICYLVHELAAVTAAERLSVCECVRESERGRPGRRRRRREGEDNPRTCGGIGCGERGSFRHQQPGKHAERTERDERRGTMHNAKQLLPARNAAWADSDEDHHTRSAVAKKKTKKKNTQTS